MHEQATAATRATPPQRAHAAREPGASARRRSRTPEHAFALQRSAGNVATRRVLARHPVEKILKFSAKWLSKRTVKTVSKHIAKHGRNIAGKAVHSIFRSPKKIRDMLELGVREATELAARNATKPADEILAEAGVRIERQARGGGKFRWLVTREFKEPIGTKGERFLAFVLDASGRMVTAFPSATATARILALGAGTSALLMEHTANAAEQIRLDAESQAKAAAEKEDSLDWQEFIPFIGDVWGGSLNEGEDAYLRQQRFYAAVVDDVLLAVENEEQRTIGGQERSDLAEHIRASIGAPYLIDEAE